MGTETREDEGLVGWVPESDWGRLRGTVEKFVVHWSQRFRSTFTKKEDENYAEIFLVCSHHKSLSS